VFALMLR